MLPTQRQNALPLRGSSSLPCATVNTCHDLRCHFHVSSCYTMRLNGLRNSLHSVIERPYGTISNTYQYAVLADVCYLFALSAPLSTDVAFLCILVYLRYACILDTSRSPRCCYMHIKDLNVIFRSTRNRISNDQATKHVQHNNNNTYQEVLQHCMCTLPHLS